MASAQDLLRSSIQQLMLENEKEYKLPPNRVPLSSPTFGLDEILEVVDSLVTTYVTQGKKVRRFEEEFATYLGTKHAVMVNSGSSANLLCFSALTSRRNQGPQLNPGDEVIVPAVTWPTTIYPIVQCGLKPVVADVNLQDFNIDLHSLEQSLSSKTKAVCIVPILGAPCDMDPIVEFCQQNNLILIEDTCESLGSVYKQKKAGTFGHAGTFSFFFSHHMTSVEGGMVVTDDDAFADVLRCQRAHGWVRDMKAKETLSSQYPNFDRRFLFYDLGYNVRASELNAAMALHQLKKLNAMNDQRQTVASGLLEGLAKFEKHLHLPKVVDGATSTWFGFPFLVRPEGGFERNQVAEHLENHGIETRPITGGNLTCHPSFETFEWRKGTELANADHVQKYGIYFGTHPGMTQEHVDHVLSTFANLFGGS